MNLQVLVSQWLADNHPDIKIDRGVLCLPISSEWAQSENDVWYVCRVDEDRVHLFKPASRQFGPDIAAGLPTFFEQLDTVIKYYKSYVC